MKYRMVFGRKDHSKYPSMDKTFTKTGYKHMYGHVHLSGGDKRTKYPTSCWGINAPDRLKNLDNMPGNKK